MPDYLFIIRILISAIKLIILSALLIGFSHSQFVLDTICLTNLIQVTSRTSGLYSTDDNSVAFCIDSAHTCINASRRLNKSINAPMSLTLVKHSVQLAARDGHFADYNFLPTTCTLNA